MTSPDFPSRPPPWSTVLAVAAFAAALRGVVFAAVAARLHLSVDGYAKLYDGNSYLIVARAMLGDAADLTAAHARVFSGYPAIVAAAHLLFRTPLAGTALAIDWVSAGVAAGLSARLFRDVRVGLAVAALIPHYLMNSTMAMSEAPLLALTVAGLLLADRRPFIGGLVLGFAGLVRPMACFAVAGVAFQQSPAAPPRVPHTDLRRGRWAPWLVAAGAAAVVVAGGVAMHRWRGDALANVHGQAGYAYHGHLLDWPFRSLVMTPLQRHVPVGRTAYLYAHVAFAGLACMALWRRRRSDPADLSSLSLPWLWGNTAFACCVGDIWGFECFHRFLVPALPPLLWAVRRWLPTRPIGWAVVTVVSTVVAVLSVGSG